MKFSLNTIKQIRRCCLVAVTIGGVLPSWTFTAQAQTQKPQSSPQPLGRLPAQGQVIALKSAPKGTLLACLALLRSADWQLQVWDMRTQKLKWKVTRPFILSFDFSADGTKLAYFESREYEAIPPKPQTEQFIQICQAQSGTPVSIIAAPDGDSIEAPWEGLQFGSDNHTLFLSRMVKLKDKDGFFLRDDWKGSWFDAQTGRCVHEVTLFQNYKDDITLPLVPSERSWDASAFVYGILLSPRNKALLVDMQTSQFNSPVPKQDSDGALTDNGHVCYVHHVWLCNLNGEFERQIASPLRLILGLSSDESRLICTDDLHHVQLFDVQSSQLLHTLMAPKHYGIQFGDSTNFFHGTDGLVSHDGSRAFATLAQDGGTDKDSHVGEWDIASGRFLALFGHWSSRETCSTLALSGDDTILAHAICSGSDHLDESVQLWKVK